LEQALQQLLLLKHTKRNNIFFRDTKETLPKEGSLFFNLNTPSMPFTYTYPRPAVTVDIIVLRKGQEKKEILLIKRKHPPFENGYALPGGFVDAHENLIDAAYRELKEETNISHINLEQFYTFGDKGRDPRGHTVSVVYYGTIDSNNNEEKAGDDAASLKWFEINKLPDLAFDHKEIIAQFILKALQNNAV